MVMDAVSFARTRKELRENLENRRGIAMTAEELRTFLAAADRLDALEAAVRDFCDKLCPMTSGAYDIDYDALARLEALVDAPA